MKKTVIKGRVIHNPVKYATFMLKGILVRSVRKVDRWQRLRPWGKEYDAQTKSLTWALKEFLGAANHLLSSLSLGHWSIHYRLCSSEWKRKNHHQLNLLPRKLLFPMALSVPFSINLQIFILTFLQWSTFFCHLTLVFFSVEWPCC